VAPRKQKIRTTYIKDFEGKEGFIVTTLTLFEKNEGWVGEMGENQEYI